MSKSNYSLKLKDSTLSSTKETLTNLIIHNCLNKTKPKSKSTFKIEMSGSTRLLLVKRDFQLEYDQLFEEVRTNSTITVVKKFSLFLRKK